jgi:two-component system KDP operon response regulator KdpE
MTPTEFRLLCLLMTRAGDVLTCREISDEIWGPQDAVETSKLRVNMTSLRRKIEDDPTRPHFIFPVTGVGYRFAAGNRRAAARPQVADVTSSKSSSL